MVRSKHSGFNIVLYLHISNGLAVSPFFYIVPLMVTLYLSWLHCTSHGYIQQVLLLAMCFRQTCVVWVVFTAGAVGLKTIEPELNLKKGGCIMMQQ